MHAPSLTLRLTLWATFACLALWATDASPRTGATLVALVTSDPPAELSHRVEEQLEALGFDVVVLNPPVTGSAGPTSLEQTARNVGAIAAVRIVPIAQSVQVWTADPVTGQAVFRETVPPAGQKPSDAAVALGAVELLRASLLELHPPEPFVAPKPPPPAPVCPPTPPAETPREPGLGLAAGFGIDLGLAGRPSASLALAIWARLHGPFGVRALAMTTVAPAGVSASSYGDVEVGAQVFGAELTYDLADPSAAWMPTLGLGIAAAHLTVRGEAAAASSAGNLYEEPWFALPLAHVGLGYAARPGLRLRGDLLGGISLPRADVCVEGAQGCISVVASWGRPLVSATLGLEVLLSR